MKTAFGSVMFVGKRDQVDARVDDGDRDRAPRALTLPKRVPGLGSDPRAHQAPEEVVQRFSFGDAKEQEAQEERRKQVKVERHREVRVALERFARPERGFD